MWRPHLPSPESDARSSAPRPHLSLPTLMWPVEGLIRGSNTCFRICAAPTPGIEHVSPAPAVTLAASAPVTAPDPVFKYVAPVTKYALTSPASAYAAPVPVTGPVAPVTESMSPAAGDAAPDPVIDSVAPGIECMSPTAAFAAPDPVMEHVTSALGEPIPVDEHMSEEQLTTAVAALRQRETVLQSLLEAEASRLETLVQGAARAQEDQTQEALT